MTHFVDVANFLLFAGIAVACEYEAHISSENLLHNFPELAHFANAAATSIANANAVVTAPPTGLCMLLVTFVCLFYSAGDSDLHGPGGGLCLCLS